jgi:hypothetical protein
MREHSYQGKSASSELGALMSFHRVALAGGLSAIFMGISPVIASPVLDGSGFGLPSSTVVYDPAAPVSNFGAPGLTTDGAAYDIYTRADATYAYVLVSQNGTGGTSAGAFANLYFGTGASAMLGSDVGFEVTNADVFSPGNPGSKSTIGAGIEYAVLSGGTAIEFAAPFSYFETDPQGIGFDTTSAAEPDIILRLSQSFGYSVAGGATYGPDRLGLIVDPIGSTPVPEPVTLSLFCAGFAGIAAVRRRRKLAQNA